MKLYVEETLADWLINRHINHFLSYSFSIFMLNALKKMPKLAKFVLFYDGIWCQFSLLISLGGNSSIHGTWNPVLPWQILLCYGYLVSGLYIWWDGKGANVAPWLYRTWPVRNNFQVPHFIWFMHALSCNVTLLALHNCIDSNVIFWSVLGTPDEETLPGVTMYFPGIVNQEIYPPQVSL